MSLNLYQEAIIEAKQLKEVAEQNAKNKIIEALTPQIQLMIEQQLDDEFEEETSEFEEIEASPQEPALTSPQPPTATIDLSSSVEDEEVAFGEEEDEDDESDVTIDIDGELSLDFENEDDDDDDDDEDLLLSKAGVEMLESYIHKSRNQKLANRVVNLQKRLSTLKEAVSGIDFRELNLSEKKVALTYYGKLLNELFSLSQSVIIMSESVDERLEYRILGMLKEMKDMSRTKDKTAFRRLFEELAQDEGLREQEEEVAVEDEEIDVEEEVEVPQDVDVDVAAATGALEDLGVALGLDVSVEEEVEVEEEVDVEEEEGIDLELEEGDMEEMYEISESAIRRELRRMRRLREQEEGRAAAADPALAHGGEDEGDLVIDVDEETLLNALADELGDPGVPTPTVESRRRRSARRRSRSRKINESRRRSRLTSNPATRENVRLKKQLQEMNLFNAKLLFANKLMQNRGLSTKQQRAIVEALDKASTIKEAKLLYKALSESLQRRSGRTLSEGSSRLLSSSSRSTRSAAPAKSGVEVDRWAVLAGLHNK